MFRPKQIIPPAPPNTPRPATPPPPHAQHRRLAHPPIMQPPIPKIVSDDKQPKKFTFGK